MNKASRCALSTMNYIILRDIFKEDYPESIKEEISFFFEGLVQALTALGPEDCDMLQTFRGYVYEELTEGCYTDDIAAVPQMIKTYCTENMDLSDEEVEKVYQFYQMAVQEQK